MQASVLLLIQLIVGSFYSFLISSNIKVALRFLASSLFSATPSSGDLIVILFFFCGVMTSSFEVVTSWHDDVTILT